MLVIRFSDFKTNQNLILNKQMMLNYDFAAQTGELTGFEKLYVRICNY
ncbi:hypothetical protein BH10BAC5_BH10BAC5_00540 [soil metagenome]